MAMVRSLRFARYITRRLSYPPPQPAAAYRGLAPSASSALYAATSHPPALHSRQLCADASSPPLKPSATATEANAPGSTGSAQTTAEEKAKMHMLFTCGQCGTRALRSFSKRAYTHGVVIVTCPGCDARHLIADNKGWFGEERNIEEVMRKRGVRVPVLRDGTLEIDDDAKPN